MKRHNDNKGRRWLIAAALALAVGATGVSFASGGVGLSGHHGYAGHMPTDPAALDAHIDRMVLQFAAEASPDQRMRVAAIAKAAITDLRATHAEFREGHAGAHALLMAPVIDRAALEQLRAAQMQRMDIMSRRILTAVEDASDVLTPEQRARLAGHLRTFMH
jgi:Spy/CpxP family protein refolding chaperone